MNVTTSCSLTSQSDAPPIWVINHMRADARKSAQGYFPDCNIPDDMMTRKIRQFANVSHGQRIGRLKEEFFLQGCERHKQNPHSDCELCKFRSLVLPRGEALTPITVHNERIVTRAELQDIEEQNSSSSNSQPDQRIFIEIETEKVPEIKKRYHSFSLVSIFDDENDPPDINLEDVASIDLRSDSVDRQSPWELNEQAYGNVERHHFASTIGRRISCSIHGDIPTSTSMLMMKYPTCVECRKRYAELAQRTRR